MRVLYLELYRNRRLMVRNLVKIKLTFTDLMQMLLGTNGSGKTTVLRECGPFFKADDFAAGGYKEIHIEHEGHIFKIKAFKEDHKKAFYEFFMDDSDNLNQSRLITAQRQLIQTHLRLTEDLQDFLLGVKNKRFTNMNAAKRREWLMMISGDDLEYAFRVHNKLKERLRETTTVYKHNLQRAAKLKEESQHDIPALKQDAHRISEEIDVLQNLKFNHVDSPETLDNELKKMMRVMDGISSALLLIDVKRPDGLEQYRFDSLESVQSVISRLQGFKQSLVMQRSTMTEEYQRVQELLSANSEDNLATVAKLKADILKDSLRLDAMLPLFSKASIVEEPEQAFKDFMSIKDDLVDLIEGFVDNFDDYLNKTEFQKMLALKNELRLRLDNYTREKEKIFHELDHFRSTKDVECPKCTATFKPNLIHVNPALLEKRIIAISTEQEKLEATLDDADAYIQKCNTFLSSKGRLNGFIKGYPRLKQLWDSFGEIGFYSVSSRFPSAIQSWELLCLNSIEYTKLETRLTENRVVVDRALELQKAAGQGIGEQAKVLEASLSDNTLALRTTDDQLAKLTRYRANLSKFLEGRRRVESMLTDVQRLYKQLNESVFNETLTRYLLQHRTLLSEVMSIINNAEMLDALLKDIEEQNKVLSERQKAIEVLQQAISPVTGLIAKRSNAFNNCFTEQLNLLIKQIWTHPLIVRPCGYVSGEVDYRFPMVVHDSDLVIADVSEGSDSQVDFVDFACRIVTMLYLNMEGYPLYVDELAPSLDETHRVNLVNFLKRLIETKRCSQMFMISHYASTHQAFINFETCVMSEDNMINLPDTYNEHVVFEYA